MSQRTFQIIGVITGFGGSPVVGAPCSFVPLFPSGLAGAIDGNGAVVQSAPIAFTTDAGGNLVALDCTSPVLIDYPGDYQSAYQATQVQVTLNWQAYISPLGFSYASTIAVSSWISAPVTTGLVAMRFVYTEDNNTPIVGALVSVSLIAPALVVATGQQLSASVPSQALTDSSGTATLSLNPNSLLNPSNLGYAITVTTPDGSTEIIPWIATVPAAPDVYRGAYNSGTTYSGASGTSNGDVVTSGGVLYRFINVTPSSGHAPPNATYWQVVSGLPTDLLSAHATFSAQVGQMVMDTTSLPHDVGLPVLVDDPVTSPVSLHDDLTNLAQRTNRALRTIAANAAVNATTDDWIIADASGGAVTLTLPTASARVREYFIIRKNSGANVVIARAGADTINGATSFTLSSQYQWAIIRADTANGAWYVQTGTAGGAGGSASFSYVTKATNYTITGADSGIAVDASAGNVTITLPSAVGVTQLFAIKRVDISAHAVNIATTGGQSIDGATPIPLTLPNQEYVLASNGANWYIYSSYYPNPLTTEGDIPYWHNGGIARATLGSTLAFTAGVLNVVGGGTSVAWVTKSGNYTLLATDSDIRADCSGGAITLTLPAASGFAGRYVIKKIDVTGNVLTIAAHAGDTIAGTATFKIFSQGVAVQIASDGFGAWHIEADTGHDIPVTNGSGSLVTNGSGMAVVTRVY